jgi:hypothetical protein
MNEEQERQQVNWAIGRSMKATDAEKWTWIFEALFPYAIENRFPVSSHLIKDMSNVLILSRV